MERQKVKCERCGVIDDLCQYTFFDTEAHTATKVVDNGVGANPRFTTEPMRVDRSLGYCKDCATEVNKWRHDLKEQKDFLDRMQNQILDNVAISIKPLYQSPPK